MSIPVLFLKMGHRMAGKGGMAVHQKVTGTATTIPVGLLWSGLVSLGITILGSAVAAWLVLNRRISPDGVGYCAMGILLLASIAGAVTAIRKIKRLRFQMSMAAGAVYYGCLVVITALFFGGAYHGLGVTALLIFGGCGTVALMGSPQQGRRPSLKNSRKW